MASARDRSVYEEFTIESADGSKTVDIKDGVSAFVYYESILSPCVISANSPWNSSMLNISWTPPCSRRL